MTEAREKKKEEDIRRLHITANRCSAAAEVAGRRRGNSTRAYAANMPPRHIFFFCLILTQAVTLNS